MPILFLWAALLAQEADLIRLLREAVSDDASIRRRAGEELVKHGDPAFPFLKKAQAETIHRIEKERLQHLLRAMDLSKILGEDLAWRFLDTPEGVPRLDLLLAERRDLKLDRASGLLLADGIVGAIDWTPVYDPLRQRESSLVWDKVVTGRWTAMAWLYVRLLENDCPWVRETALAALGALGAEATAGDVARLLDHPQAATRAWALAALSKLKAKAFQKKVARGLKDRDPMVRRCAVAALGDLCDAEALPEIASFLEGDDRLLRAQAAMTLEQIGSAEALAPLRKALEKERGNPRGAGPWIEFAIRSLEEIRTRRDPVPLLGRYFGTDSRIREREFHRIDTPEKWSAFWARHRGGRAPEVDFDRSIVVAVLLGRTHGSTGVEAVSIAEDYEKVILRVDDCGIQQAGSEAPPPVTPFGLFVLPASTRTVVVQLPERSALDDPALWKEAARLSP